MLAVKFKYSPDDFPEYFDARKKWGEKIHVIKTLLFFHYQYGFLIFFFTIQGVRDQGWCGASWAFSTSSVAADRLRLLLLY